jgi:transposase
MNELQHIIEQKQELLAREAISRPAVDYSKDMTAEEQKRYINYLAERLEKADLGLRARDAVLQDFLDKQKEYDERLSKLDDVLSDMEDLKKNLTSEVKKRKAAERKVADLTAKLKFANKNRFGNKSYGSKKKNPEEESDRTKDKDDFDGTSSSLPGNSIANKESEPSATTASQEKKSRDLSNRPDTYNTMGVQGTSKEYRSDLSKIPGRILERKMVPVFHLEVNLVEERFEMVHYVEKGKKPKWGYFPKAGNPQVVTKFDGTKATPEFLQAIAYEVYVKNVTFGLLHRWLTDLGMKVSANTLRNWLKKGKKYLDELVKVLKEVALEKDSIVNCDETWCKVRKYDHYKKCYIWVLVNKAEQTVIFFYEDGSRGRDVLTHFIGDAELKSVMTDGYNAYVFIGDELSAAEQSPNLKKAIHQVCMAHFKAKLDKALEQAGDTHACPFLSGVDFYYKRERQYDAEGLTPEERVKRRQDLESKDMQITLRQYLKIELDKDPSETTPYLREALNYLDKFWNNIFAFLKDGNLPIDNNLAERTIRPLTTQRNAMLHFGSDEGVEMAATYHSIISTVKMQGKSAWEYLGKFFTKIFNGCKDFISLRPDKIGLAICQ